MFGRYLDAHSLTEMLTDGSFCLFPSMDDRTAWDQVDGGEILRLAQMYSAVPYPMRRAADFLAFVRDGSRKADEEPYFLRRRKLCVAALHCCVTGRTELLDQVVDGLWCICEESSWVISAHNVNSIPGAPRAAEFPLPDPDAPYVDLFAGQTAMILTLVCSVLARQLDAVTPMLRQRVHREIHRRVLRPFMVRDDFWWMGFIRKDLCNWTPWIISNVLLTAAHLCDRQTLFPLMDRALRMVDRWLDCVPADGGCDEGAGYWNMAGGALLDCLELLEKLTAGRMTFWEQEKIRNILQFPVKAQLGGGWFVNFADCDARPHLAGERLQLAGEKLHDQALIALGLTMRGSVADQLSDTPQLWRALNLMFHPEWRATAAVQPRDVWLPDLQLRVLERQGMVLCCKGGHNGESHNHNDVGSFMLYVDGCPAVVDAGNLVYTAKTFSDERYTLWNTRSAYHNLPMIGLCEQQPGSNHRAREVQYLPDGLALDMAEAYGAEAGIQRCQRRLTLSGAGLTVQDDITLDRAETVRWVFMLRAEPRIQAGSMRAGQVRLSFGEELSAAVEEIPVTDPRMAESFPGSLWRLTLTGPAAHRHCQTFLIERIDQHE